MVISDHLLKWAELQKVSKEDIIKEVEKLTKKLKSIVDIAPKEDRLTMTRSLLDALSENNKHRIEIDSLKVSCTEGCGHCCHQTICISDDEENLILDYVKMLSPVLMERLKKQANFSKDDYHKAIEQDSRCVFLIDNRCKIYPVRPSTCRNYFVKNDPEYCKNKYNDHRDEHPLEIGIIAPSYLYASALYNISANRPSPMAKRLYERWKND